MPKQAQAETGLKLTAKDAYSASRYTSVVTLLSIKNACSLFFKNGRVNNYNAVCGLVDSKQPLNNEINCYNSFFGLQDEAKLWTTAAYIINQGFFKFPGLYKQEVYLKNKLGSECAASALVALAATTIESPVILTFAVADALQKTYRTNARIATSSKNTLTKCRLIGEATILIPLDTALTIPVLATSIVLRPLAMGVKDIYELTHPEIVDNTATTTLAPSPVLPSKRLALPNRDLIEKMLHKPKGYYPSQDESPLNSPENSPRPNQEQGKSVHFESPSRSRKVFLINI